MGEHMYSTYMVYMGEHVYLYRRMYAWEHYKCAYIWLRSLLSLSVIREYILLYKGIYNVHVHDIMIHVRVMLHVFTCTCTYVCCKSLSNRFESQV